MEMCYVGALVMPNSYAVMNEEEMMYTEGGAKLKPNQIALTKRMFDRSYCKKIAKNYIKATGLSQLRIAKEIFAHAYLFLGGVTARTVLRAHGIMPDKVINYILTHSNPVDLGGDGAARKAVFQLIWTVAPNI